MADLLNDRPTELALACAALSISPPSVSSLSNSEKFEDFVSDSDKVKTWIQLSDSLKNEKELDKNLQNLDKTLLSVVFVIENKLSLGDVFLYVALHPVLAKLNDKQKGKLTNVVRYFDFLQNQSWNTVLPPVISKRSVVLQGFSVSLDSSLTTFSNTSETKPAEKPQERPQERPQEQKQEQPQQQQKEEKQQQQQQQPKAQAKEKKNKHNDKQPAAQPTPEEPTPSALDIRVGKVIQVEKHPDADSLYVEKIDLGEAEPRTIVSGLVKFISIEDFQNQLVLVLCNLKPAAMRGIKSSGMVLCASNDTHDVVELVQPPANTPVGERIFVEGEGTPSQAQEPILNPKKKVWETLQPGLKTNAEFVATWNGKPLTTSQGVCKAKSLVGASIK